MSETRQHEKRVGWMRNMIGEKPEMIEMGP